MPATRALSVPWPRWVREKELNRVKSTRASGRGASRRATRAMRSAPAVCELDGPTMMGPSTSNADIPMVILPIQARKR